MKYYSFRTVVIKCTEDDNWRDVVYKMRHAYNKDSFHPLPIMIEDISIATEQDYLKYINSPSKNIKIN